MESPNVPAQRGPGQRLGQVPGSRRFYGPEEWEEGSRPLLGLTNSWRKSYNYLGGSSLSVPAHLPPTPSRREWPVI